MYTNIYASMDVNNYSFTVKVKLRKIMGRYGIGEIG